jgi:hypothetical protein
MQCAAAKEPKKHTKRGRVFTHDELYRWLENPLYNPRSGYPIRYKGPTYLTLLRQTHRSPSTEALNQSFHRCRRHWVRVTCEDDYDMRPRFPCRFCHYKGLRLLHIVHDVKGDYVCIYCGGTVRLVYLCLRCRYERDADWEIENYQQDPP